MAAQDALRIACKCSDTPLSDIHFWKFEPTDRLRRLRKLPSNEAIYGTNAPSGADRLHQRRDSDDAHHALEIVGQHVQAHLRANLSVAADWKPPPFKGSADPKRTRVFN